MKDYSIKNEFGKQAKKFRIHFGLDQQATAGLSDMSTSEYSDLENGNTNYNVEKIQNVSSIYGLFFYQFGNPACNFPTFSDLPKKTQAAIQSRTTPLKIYNSRLIIEHLTAVFNTMNANDEFLIKDISTIIKDNFKISYKNEEIAGTINKNFKDLIVKTEKQDTSKMGVGPKPFYYKILKNTPFKKTIQK